MKYYFQVVFILAISFLMSNDANAQLRKKTTSLNKRITITRVIDNNLGNKKIANNSFIRENKMLFNENFGDFFIV